MKHVTDDKLQVYVESLAVQQFSPDHRAERLPLCLSILRGLAKAMALPNPGQNCWTFLCSTTEKIFHLLPDRIQVFALLQKERLDCKERKYYGIIIF